ncbi:MAG: PAS domain-containing protein [Minwuia sp.]|uniref:PAS domain-containing protein n=1 Tax=Minwuia sp. TaxID=2493630 RepID=UPI003A8939E6
MNVTGPDFAQSAAEVLRDIPDAVVISDREGIIRFWNAGAERVFGFAADEALGQSLDIIIPERLRRRHWDGYFAMIAAGRSTHAADEVLSVPALHSQGRTLSVRFTVAPVMDASGVIAGVAAIMRDGTAAFEEMKRLRGLARDRSTPGA